MNDGESSPSWEAASAAETDAAACRRSDGTASGALLPEHPHHASLLCCSWNKIIPRTLFQQAQGSPKTCTMCCLSCSLKCHMGGPSSEEGQASLVGVCLYG